MNEQPQYSRFKIAPRIEHLVLILSFTLLAITGLPQKYSLLDISQATIHLFGGIGMIRVIHRLASIILILEAVYHLVSLGYKLFVLRLEASMMPRLKDAVDGIQETLYNLGLRKELPRMGHYNFKEKMEYWALIWGLVIMTLTGFMMWNPLFVTQILPGQFIPAAKAAHGAEAVLAVLAVILWHFYNVHLRSWNKSMINGKMSRAEMEEEHAGELEKIDSGLAPQPVDKGQYRRRMRVFVPLAIVISLLLVVGLYGFATFEQTALITLPISQPGLPVFVPQTPTPRPTPSGEGSLQPDLAHAISWAGGDWCFYSSDLR